MPENTTRMKHATRKGVDHCTESNKQRYIGVCPSPKREAVPTTAAGREVRRRGGEGRGEYGGGGGEEKGGERGDGGGEEEKEKVGSREGKNEDGSEGQGESVGGEVERR